MKESEKPKQYKISTENMTVYFFFGSGDDTLIEIGDRIEYYDGCLFDGYEGPEKYPYLTPQELRTLANTMLEDADRLEKKKS